MKYHECVHLDHIRDIVITSAQITELIAKRSMELVGQAMVTRQRRSLVLLASEPYRIHLKGVWNDRKTNYSR